MAIDGETAARFMSGVGRTPPVMRRTDIPLAQQNLNYASSPTTPQAVLFNNLVASEAAAGNTINTISITLGFNELAALANLPTSRSCCSRNVKAGHGGIRFQGAVHPFMSPILLGARRGQSARARCLVSST